MESQTQVIIRMKASPNSGNREDFDHWARLGNYGWSYEDVLPYFKMSEDMLEPIAAKDKSHHGTGGPLGVEYPGFRTRMSDVFMEAARYLGFEENHDFNAPFSEGYNQMGFGRFHMTTR